MRLGASVLIAIVLIIGAGVQQGQGQAGLPDLAVKAIRVSPSELLEDGQPAQLRAIIVNKGQGDVIGAFDVIFELDGREVATRSLFELKKQQTRELHVPWQARVGTHQLTISVDAPFNNVRESNESNNKASFTFSVAPLAGVRSFSLDFVKLFGRSLDEAGQALHFELTDNIFTAIDNAVRAMQDTAAALRNSSIELQLLRGAVPPMFASHSQFSEADSLVVLFDALAESFLRIGGTLSIGNFDGVLENARTLRQGLVQLAGQKLAGVAFAPVQSAVVQFDRVIALATELRDLLQGAQGRPQYQVAVELFNAFTVFGEQLCASSREFVQYATTRSARFYNGNETVNGAYVANKLLTIAWSGVILMRFELYELTSGALVYQSEEVGPSLDWAANGSLSTGTYSYKLVGILKNGVERSEIGRLQITQATSSPPTGKQNAPPDMDMSGR
jgi:hypothetical protein